MASREGTLKASQQQEKPLSAKVDTLQGEYGLCQEHSAALSVDLDKARADLKEIGKVNEEMARVASEVAVATQAITEQKTKISTLQQDLESSQGTRAGMEEWLRERECALDELKVQTQSLTKENDQLKLTQSAMKAQVEAAERRQQAVEALYEKLTAKTNGRGS